MSGRDEESDESVPEEVGEQSFDGSADEFGEDSPTWGAADPDFDRMLRDRIGSVEPMPTPPYAFERVLMAGRRRRARKLWAGASAAALVVMAGTAGTTVALHPGPSGVPAAAGSSDSTVLLATSQAAVPSTSDPAASPSPSTSPSPSAAASSAAPSASSDPTAQCLSTDMNATGVAKPSASGKNATLVVTLKNTSGHSCITDGYPGLEFAPAGGTPLQPVTETRVSAGLKRELSVAANGTVSTLVTYQTTASGATPGADCYTPSVYVLIIPPNQQDQLMATISGGPVTVCADGAVSLTPLVAGSNG